MGGECANQYEAVASGLLENFNIQELASFSVDRWMQEKMIGRTKALQLVAAFQLTNRLNAQALERPKINSSRDCFDVFCAKTPLKFLQHEEFWIMYMTRNNHVMSVERLSVGGCYGTIVDVKLVFQKAIEKRAGYLILAHNHPSGSLSPSHADIALTNRLVAAGKLLDINVLDHVIISGTNYFSFLDEGKMNL